MAITEQQCLMGLRISMRVHRFYSYSHNCDFVFVGRIAKPENIITDGVVDKLASYCKGMH